MLGVLDFATSDHDHAKNIKYTGQCCNLSKAGRWRTERSILFFAWSS